MSRAQSTGRTRDEIGDLLARWADSSKSASKRRAGDVSRVNQSPHIDLIYDSDCPHIELARTMIRSALEQIRAQTTWTEWDLGDARTSAEMRRYGSPTVLVNGRDVALDDDEHCLVDANSCRVYTDSAGHVYGAPPASLILSAIQGNQAA